MKNSKFDEFTPLLSRISVEVGRMKKRGDRPTRLHLTSDDAVQLQYELIAEGGPLAHRIMLGGLRRAMSEIDGMTIIWKSEHFAVS